MKILTGLLKYHTGRVKIFGEEVKLSPARARRSFGFLPDAQMPPNYSIERFLTITGRMNRISNLQSSMRSVLQKLGLAKIRQRKIGTLSRGQKQRVGLANALLHDPPLLILDEPNMGLDPLGRVRVLKILKDLAAEGKTIFLSSHILGEIEKVATHVGIIHEGKIIEQGKREDLQKRFMQQSKYVIEGHLEIERVLALDYVKNCDKDPLGRYQIRIDDTLISAEQLLLDVIQQTNAQIRYFSRMDLNLEEFFLEQINDISDQEVS
jgi:ABC-2 type transport system ATP-binding protein